MGKTVMLLLVVGVAWGAVSYVRSGNDCPQPGGARAAVAMQAYVHCEYGPPSVLRLETLAKPAPNDSQVLVRVHAVSLNPADWHTMRGTPMIARPSMGWRVPSDIVAGTDFAGVVESVGRAVTRVQPGDTVFGAGNGSFAEFVVARESRVMKKPRRITMEQAAAIPVAAITALQGVRDQGRVRAGQRVLVNGASGGVGTFAVQVAKSLGAVVTGVSSGRNVALVQSLGADRVIDYTKADFTTQPERYDAIIDMVGNHPLGALRQVLTPTGTYVMIGGPSGRWLDPMPRAAATVIRSWFGRQPMRFFIASFNEPDLRTLQALVDSGGVTPVVDRTYTFDQLPAAMAYLETGRARGKVVVSVP
ncbi:MAG: NAD(P)-dependent alcohol dehydrogenase [Gemmatimonadaceae bacterium]|nr:NAD(P)-dependent alcohol dehydrogenase [Gemmatimonadaceae bacterium]